VSVRESLGMSERRFPPPWTVEKIPGGLKVPMARDSKSALVLNCTEFLSTDFGLNAWNVISSAGGHVASTPRLGDDVAASVPAFSLPAHALNALLST
jgi:hypothetical protein